MIYISYLTTFYTQIKAVFGKSLFQITIIIAKLGKNRAVWPLFYMGSRSAKQNLAIVFKPI